MTGGRSTFSPWTPARLGGSDRLVDALVAWGDADAVKARIQAHHDAGADHVCIQPVTTDLERGLAELAQLAQVAP